MNKAFFSSDRFVLYSDCCLSVSAEKSVKVEIILIVNNIKLTEKVSLFRIIDAAWLGDVNIAVGGEVLQSYRQMLLYTERASYRGNSTVDAVARVAPYATSDEADVVRNGHCILAKQSLSFMIIYSKQTLIKLQSTSNCKFDETILYVKLIY
ncbi:hypothetical protein Tsp_13967 [Trichinella spiralis]|uniref:hypothetical protein n=1 Tax=Trichinella spiralis TaxID=6334 RepID=UPI0001EFDECA|nr:hypothetical protein Tsp_13967 [Trichinella spiralis]